ncbi:Hypothetical predicted protein [Xyrichtys novacula]|uniref:Uncharacterized protein n=1 Tax=Xyrichtys novacula TaxID=13765 RepID=A0AAV1FJE9_XYRNO|nr:Hypothetical predicted protein [Xyrichtys novacula]
MESTASKSWYDMVVEEEENKVQELMDVISALNQKLEKATGDLKTVTEEKKALARQLQSRWKMHHDNEMKWSRKMMALDQQLKQSQQINLELSSSLKRQEEDNQRLQVEILELQEEKDQQILKADNLQKQLEEVRQSI